MSLALALAQIQRPSFWDDFKACDRYEDNREKIKAVEADNEALRTAAHQQLLTAGRPIPHAELVKRLDSSANRVGFVLGRLYEENKVKRHFISDTLWVAATEFADFTNLKRKNNKTVIAERNAELIKSAITEAIRSGVTKLAEIEKATGYNHCTVSKYTTLMRSAGEIVATKQPGDFALTLSLVAKK